MAEAEERERGRVRANPPWMLKPPPFMFDKARRKIVHNVLILLVLLFIIVSIPLIRYFDVKETRICLFDKSAANSTKAKCRSIETGCPTERWSCWLIMFVSVMLLLVASFFFALLLYSGVYEYEDDESEWLKTRCWWRFAATWLLLYMVAGIFIFVMRVISGPWEFNRKRTVPFQKMAEREVRKRRENPHGRPKILSKTAFRFFASIAFLLLMFLFFAGGGAVSKQREEIQARCFKADLKDDSSNLNINTTTACGFMEEFCAAHSYLCPLRTAEKLFSVLACLCPFASILVGSVRWEKCDSGQDPSSSVRYRQIKPFPFLCLGITGMCVTIVGNDNFQYSAMYQLVQMMAAFLAMVPWEAWKVVLIVVSCLTVAVLFYRILSAVLRYGRNSSSSNSTTSIQ